MISLFTIWLSGRSPYSHFYLLDISVLLLAHWLATPLRLSHLYFSGSTDTPKELATIQESARAAGAFDAVVCNHWALGGAGAKALADAVQKASEQPSDFKFLYSLDVGHSSSHWIALPHFWFPTRDA